jgi:hypothetical protein
MGAGLVTGVRLGTAKMVFVFFTLRLFSEPLPLLSHFAQECLQPRINCSARFLKASGGESSISPCALHFSQFRK